MTKEELDFIGSMNMCDEISNEAYKKIVNHVEETEISDDCVSREQAKADVIPNSLYTSEQVLALLDNLSPVTPTHGTCKDCKHWKDSDGVYRRGISAESKCPLNILQVFDGDFYCKDFEKRGNENDC